jgi:hypothetical protein
MVMEICWDTVTVTVSDIEGWLTTAPLTSKVSPMVVPVTVSRPPSMVSALAGSTLHVTD